MYVLKCVYIHEQNYSDQCNTERYALDRGGPECVHDQMYVFDRDIIIVRSVRALCIYRHIGDCYGIGTSYL
jgi:hypothetical protein